MDGWMDLANVYIATGEHWFLRPLDITAIKYTYPLDKWKEIAM